MIIYREEPPPHGPVCPQLQAGAAAEEGVRGGAAEHLQAGRVEVEAAAGETCSLFSTPVPTGTVKQANASYVATVQKYS